MRSKSASEVFSTVPILRDAGVVNQYVDALRILVGVDARESGLDRVGDCNVAVQCRRRTSSRANTLDGAAGSFQVAIESKNAGAVAREGRRDRLSNPRAGAGDNRGLAVESKHAPTLKQANAA